MSKNKEKVEGAQLGIVDRLLGVKTGQVAGQDQDVDPKPWDNAKGDPITGEEGVMPSTFEADTASNANIDTKPHVVAYRLEDNFPTRAEQPTDWAARKYTLAVNQAKQIVDANPRRIRFEVYVLTSNIVHLGPSNVTATFGFPCEDGTPFKSEVTNEVWAYTGTAQDVYVVEYFRSAPNILEG